jgi:RNA polymerase sigma factor (sigma-70 family)
MDADNHHLGHLSGRVKYAPLRKLTPEEQQLVTDNQGLVWKEARRIACALARRRYGWAVVGFKAITDQYFDDLIDAGWIGLSVAAQRYITPWAWHPYSDLPWDEETGAKFSSFAYHWIRSYIGIAAESADLRVGPQYRSGSKNQIRIPIHFSELERVSDSHGNPSSHREENHIFEVLDREETEEVEKELPEQLLLLLKITVDSDRDFRLLCLHVFEDRTLQDIGNELGITRERVRQLVARALDKLRAHPGFMRALYAQADRRKRQIDLSDKLTLGRLIA